jgi:hypothetical protein
LYILNHDACSDEFLSYRHCLGREGPSTVPYGGNFAPPCEMAGGTTWRFLLIPPGYFWQYNLKGSTFDNTITQRIIFVKKSLSSYLAFVFSLLRFLV